MSGNGFNGLPTEGSHEPQPLGYEEVLNWLDESSGMYALRSIVDAVRDTSDYEPTPLVRLFASWIQDAGLEDLEQAIALGRGFSAQTGEPFLIERGSVSRDYHLRRIDERAPFSNRWLWRLEGAVNRFYHIGRILGEGADSAGEEIIGSLDESLISGRELTWGVFARDAGSCLGEWEARKRIASFVEDLVVPLGIRLGFRLDETAGVASFSFMTVNAEEFPVSRYDQRTKVWETRTYDQRSQEALVLAERLGVTVASRALEEVPALTRVTVMAFPHSDADDELASTTGAEYPVLFRGPYYYAELERAPFHDALASSADAQQILSQCHLITGEDAQTHRPFEAVEALPSSGSRMTLPEIGKVSFTEAQEEALGCVDSEGLRISSDSIVRHAAVSLARQLAETQDFQDAIGMIRAIQDSTQDPQVYAGCNRLMEAFLTDTMDGHDENAIVTSMMPVDPCETANIRAESARRMAGITGQSPDPSVLEQLLTAVEEAEAGGRLQDTPEVVHRSFETYSQRVLYNLDARDPAHPDHGKQPIPAPTSVCYSYINIASIHGQARHREETEQWCYRAITMAPTNSHVLALAGQTVASAGLLDLARDVLEMALSWTTSNHEAADVYYQLGVIAWQAGNNELGSACLQRAANLSSLVAPRALNTQWALAKASGGFPVPFVRVNDIIQESGLPLMPEEEVLAALERAAQALVDSGIFRGALDLLGDLLRTRNDPILWAVATSLYQMERLDIDNVDDLLA